MLCESQKVTLIGLVNKKKHRKLNLTYISSSCLILLNSVSNTNPSLVICGSNLMFVQGGLA